MFAHKNEPLIEANNGYPNDSAREEMTISALNFSTDDGRNIDPVTTAGLLLKSRAVRLEQFRDGQPDIDDISWHILLDLMVSMNTGKPVTAHDLAITHDLAMNTMSRYVEYLNCIGLVDKNIEAGEEGPLKLTASGNALVDDTLSKIGHELANF